VKVEVRTQAELDAALAKGDLPVLAADITFAIREGSPRVVANGSSSPTVVAYDSSSPRVVAYDSSSPRVEAYGSSSPRVVANGSSSPRVVANGSSSPTVVANGSSSPTVVAYDSSSPRVVANGSSSPTVVAYDSSSPRVVAYDSSSPTVEAYGSSSPRVVAYGIARLCVSGAVKVTASALVAIAVLAGSPAITGGGFVARKDISTPAKWCDFYGIPGRRRGGRAVQGGHPGLPAAMQPRQRRRLHAG
jgi:hypothetical protein